MIDKKYYTDIKYFEHEVQNIFKKNWFFACLTTEISKNNDFVSIDLGGTSIAIHNFKGKLVAFQNICSHRFNRIHPDGKGNKPFFCKYHGWNYNADGIPRIPKEASFEITDYECLRLKKYTLEVCGKFVFVKLENSEDANLKEYLGDYFNELEKISSFLGGQNDDGTMPHLANWKLLVENVLEGYHCPLVHKNSLVDLGYCIDYPKDIKYFKSHSSWHSPRTISEETVSKKLNFLNNLMFKHNSFYHIYIFPNLFISSTSGGFFYIGKLMPDKVDRSDLHYNFFSPQYSIELTDKEQKLDKALFSFNCESALNVLNEDKPMVEGCQSGISEDSNVGGILSVTEEIRIIEFHKNLQKQYEKFI